MIQILIDSDTFLELFFKRYILCNEVKKLEHYLETNLIDLHITHYGFDKFCRYLKRFTEAKGYRKIIRILKKRIKILPMDRCLDREALKHPLNDFESAFEVMYASKNNIGAIVTHKPSDFTGVSLQVLTVGQLEKRNCLERILELDVCPTIFSIKMWEEIESLNLLLKIENYQNNLEFASSSIANSIYEFKASFHETISHKIKLTNDSLPEIDLLSERISSHENLAKAAGINHSLCDNAFNKASLEVSTAQDHFAEILKIDRSAYDVAPKKELFFATTSAQNQIAKMAETNRLVRDEVLSGTSFAANAAQEQLSKMAEINRSINDLAFREKSIFAKISAQNHIAKIAEVDSLTREAAIDRASFAASAAQEQLRKVAEINRSINDLASREKSIFAITSAQNQIAKMAETNRLVRDEVLSGTSFAANAAQEQLSKMAEINCSINDLAFREKSIFAKISAQNRIAKIAEVDSLTREAAIGRASFAASAVQEQFRKMTKINCL